MSKKTTVASRAAWAMRGTALFLALVALTAVPQARADVHIYGYFDVNYQLTGKTPDGAKDPGEFSIPHFNVMMQSRLGENARAYINLAGDEASGLEVRNIWGEYFVKDWLKFRGGKIYRPFGLFNEKLDAVPTYLGIEPPELFDGDHLMLPRTGTLEALGIVPMGSNAFSYALMTGNTEKTSNANPLSWDLRYSIGNDWIVGTSGYWTNEQKGSPISVGEGSPPGGILPWMSSDKYTVLGGYLQTTWGNFTLKTAYWNANHNAVRDPGEVVKLVDPSNPAGLNAAQLKRFGINRLNPTDQSTIKTDGSYTVSTWYVRLGYTLEGGTLPGVAWELTPYFFWDSYSNPETIASKHFGGDNEAGVADDGKFSKPTLGIVMKPASNIAFKIDGSSHMYKWTDPAHPAKGSQNVHYEELRFDVSYFFR